MQDYQQQQKKARCLSNNNDVSKGLAKAQDPEHVTSAPQIFVEERKERSTVREKDRWIILYI